MGPLEKELGSLIHMNAGSDESWGLAEARELPVAETALAAEKALTNQRKSRELPRACITLRFGLLRWVFTFSKPVRLAR